MLRPGEYLIHDGNAHLFTDNAVVDGEPKARGLVPRDWDAHPQGCYASAPTAVDVPLIPRAEWPERIRDRVASKSQLSDIRLTALNGGPIPSRDQNGKGYCHTADTEVLTEKGWVAFPDYDFAAPVATVNPLTHRMEFQAPFERHVYEYDGPMVYSTNRRVDFGVTPDHEMYVRKWDERRRTLSDRYSFVRAGDLGWYSGLLHAPSGWMGTELVELEVPGDRRYDGDDFLALLGLVTSDGYAGGTPNTRNWVSFASFRETARPAIAALAARLGFREVPSRPGVFVRYDAPALAEWVRQHCYTSPTLGAHAKRVPDLVKVASARQIKHFLHYFDDRSRDGKYFYSASKRMIDDLQELFLRTGRRASIGDVPAKVSTTADGKQIRGGEAYVLYASEEDNLSLDRKKHIETDRYKGLVYCAGVPNHTLLTRRKGSTLVSSNCWAHSTTSAVLLIRASNNQPYADLSAYAVACVIKNYRDEGGWGAQSLDFITERGIPTSEFWPQRSMSRANDNPRTWENAALHKVVEGWVDLQSAQYDRTLSFDQEVSLLLSNTPVVKDENWWSHSICGMDPVDGAAHRAATRAATGKLATLAEFEAMWGMNDPVTGGIGVRIWNSWGDTWGDRGTSVLTGQKAVSDGAVAPRAVLAAAA